MEYWQQRAEREDPYPDVPFDDGLRFNSDVAVGIVCLIVGIIGMWL